MLYSSSPNHRPVSELWHQVVNGAAAHQTRYVLYLDTADGNHFVVEETNYTGKELAGKVAFARTLEEYKAQHPRRWSQVEAVITGKGR